jgi:hypothetical protein
MHHRARAWRLDKSFRTVAPSTLPIEAFDFTSFGSPSIGTGAMDKELRIDRVIIGLSIFALIVIDIVFVGAMIL